MDSRQFDEQFDIAGVALIPKMKSCGKSQCSACPHGPFWYARVPSYWTVANNGGMEVYLGRAWDADALLEKVAPLLTLSVRERFKAAIGVLLDRERLAKVGELLKGVERGRSDVGGVLSRAMKTHRARLMDLDKEESALKREQAALAKKLKKGASNGRH